jgi:hypothetical protein
MLLFSLNGCSFYEFKNQSGSEVRVTYERVPETAQNYTTPIKAMDAVSAAKPAAHLEQRPAETSSLDQCIAALVSKAKEQRNNVPARIAVHRFAVTETAHTASGSIEERISAAIERSILKNTDVQLITRRRLNDLQLEHTLNQAAWNTEGNKDTRIGVKSADFIIRGSYSVGGKFAQSLLEIEILDPQTGVIIGSKKCNGHSF